MFSFTLFCKFHVGNNEIVYSINIAILFNLQKVKLCGFDKVGG